MRRRRALVLSLFPVNTLATLSLVPSLAFGGTWAVGIGGGYVDRFHHTTDTFSGRVYPYSVDGTGFPTLSILSNIDGHFGVTMQAAGFLYGNADEYRRTDQVPIGIGIRYRPAAASRFEGSPYIELCPGVVWSNWRGTNYSEGDRGTYVRPGLIAGIGAQGKLVGNIGLDLGVRYYLSSDSRRTKSFTYTHTLEGLEQTGLLVNFYYALDRH